MTSSRLTIPISEGLGTLREYRTLAEHAAALVKGMQNLSPLEYSEGERFYVAAKAAIDGWVERMVVHIESAGDAEIAEGSKRLLDEAGVKVHTFLTHVAALEAGDTTRGWMESVAAIIPNTIEKIVDAGIKLWREFRSVKKEDQAQLVARLQEMRWESFSEIAAIKAPAGSKL